MQSSPHLQPIPDGLQMRESGSWVADKLDYLYRYIDVFETSMRDKWPARAYIDLFCGPGKCVDRDNGQVYLGSPLIALTTRYPFTHYYFGDIDQGCMSALRQRCMVSPYADRIRYLEDDANIVVSSLVTELQSTPSLNLAFLDPDGLELEWATVATIATVARLDLIIHYPQTGLNRSMPAASQLPAPTQVDSFFGGQEWRTIYEIHRRGEDSFLHRRLMDHFKAKLSALGYVETRRDDEVGLEPAVVNEKGVPLYRLLFASRSSLGIDFWRKVTSRNVHGQRRLPL